MTIKKSMFYSNLLMIVIPVSAVWIIGETFGDRIIKYVLSNLLES